MHGTTFKLALSNWETWLIFTSESVTWKLVSPQEVEVRKRFRASLPATSDIGQFRWYRRQGGRACFAPR